MRIKRSKHSKIVLSAINKLHSTENILSKALTHAEISHEYLVLINNEAEKFNRSRR